MIDYLFFCVWLILENLNLYDDEKINYNFVKINHSIISTLFSLCLTINIDFPLRNLFYCTSKSYFLWDLVKLLTYRFNLASFVHHICVIYVLYLFDKGLYNIEIATVFYYLEFSNIFLFVNYHLLKTNSKYYDHMSILQLLSYSYHRVYMLFILSCKYIDITYSNYLLLSSNIIIYVMGFVWWTELLRKFYKENEMIIMIKEKFDLFIDDIRTKKYIVKDESYDKASRSS